VFEAEVDCIRASLYGSLKLGPIAGRAHDLGLALRELHHNHIHESNHNIVSSRGALYHGAAFCCEQVTCFSL